MYYFYCKTSVAKSGIKGDSFILDKLITTNTAKLLTWAIVFVKYFNLHNKELESVWVNDKVLFVL